MAKNPFLIAHTQKTALNQQTAKRIQRIYKESALDIEKKLNSLRMLNPSDSLKKVYLENLLKDITKSQESFNKTVQATIISAGEQSGNIAIEAGNKLMRAAGLDIKGAYSYIPRQEMQNIISGGLYEGKWSLSQAIWKSGIKTKSDIESIVAKGLAENRSVYDISKDLEKYVDPTARKPWDWSKVYPGTSQKVDYNAQRLARTMIQHSFQSSLVQSQKDNPFCQGILWHSVGHERTCELCDQRDGQVFPVNDLPFDHPNGMCYFEPTLDKMNDIADRLADWALGGDDPAIDTYISKGLGLPLNSPRARTAVEQARKQYNYRHRALKPKFDKEAYIDKNFDNLKKKVIQSQKVKEKGEEIWKALRARMTALEEDQLRYMSTGQKKLKAIVNIEKGAYYDHGKKLINMDLYADMMNAHSKGAFTTFFHEYGHLLDYSANWGAHKYPFTFSKNFRETLYSSLEKEYNKLCINGKLLPEVRKDLLKSHASNGVQDIISGLSQNKNRVVWGHSTEYWVKKGDMGVSLETMAHFNAAWANPESAAYMEKYFPESYKYIKDIAIKYARKKGIK